MTIRHMRIFVQVYQSQNITRAASLLHMSQPAVTRAIQEIEAYYGVCLFERINRRLSVTEGGRQLYAQALHIVDAFDVMEKGLRNWDKFGVLRVGASITMGNFLLPELVSRFQKELPNLRIYASISNGAGLQDALMDNRLDLALIEGGVGNPQLHVEVFDEDRLVLVVPPSHPLLSQEEVSLEDCNGCPLLLREKGSVGRSFLDHVFAVRGITLHPVWESASTQAIVKAVGCGLGISFLPEQLVRRDIADGVVCTRVVSGVDFSRKNYIVWHKNKYLTEAAKRFIALCKDERG